MKAVKFFAVAAIAGWYVFVGSAAMAQQVCPVGGGACTPNPIPASSYSNARSVDVTRAPVAAPVVVVDSTPAPGSYCGWAVFYPGKDGDTTENMPCLGYPVYPYKYTGQAPCPSGYASIITGVNGSTVYSSCLKQ